MLTQRGSVRCFISVEEGGREVLSSTASSVLMGHCSISSILCVTGGLMWTVLRRRIFTVLMMRLLLREKQTQQLEEVMEHLEQEEGEEVVREEEMEDPLLQGVATLVLWTWPGLQGVFSLRVSTVVGSDTCCILSGLVYIHM